MLYTGTQLPAPRGGADPALINPALKVGTSNEHIEVQASGVALETEVESPKYTNKEFGDVPYLESVSTYDREKQEVTVFAVNRRPDGPLDLEATLHGMAGYSVVEHLVMESGDPKARNTAEDPFKVVPHARGDAALKGPERRLHLPRPGIDEIDPVGGTAARQRFAVGGEGQR